jgi:hypothetical protein
MSMNEIISINAVRRWEPGDTITLRCVGHHDGKVRDRPGLLFAMPHIVVRDDDEALVLWMPTGSHRVYVDMADRSRVIAPELWRLDCIRIMPKDAPYSVMLFWKTDSAVSEEPRTQTLIDEQLTVHAGQVAPGARREFIGWYVNLEARYVRTAIGVDTTDNSLDVVIAPDRTWRWKDEHLTQKWIDRGVYTEAETAQLYEDGKDAIARLEAGLFPFDGAYVDWTPARHWRIPEPHPDWPHLEGYDTPLTTGRRLPWTDTPRR